jgi:superfamily II DNA/RNA helicase
MTNLPIQMHEKILQNLKIQNLNPMQLASLEKARLGHDLLLLSATGSGKTLAFLLPLVEALQEKTKTVQVLILVPSRELALQIEQVFRQMGVNFKVNCCYGGHSLKTEKQNFLQPPALLIGTPGRIAHHLRIGTFDTSDLEMLILDEFDKSLEFGFQEEMAFIISQLPVVKQRILTSATSLGEIPAFTGLKNPVILDFLGANAPLESRLSLQYLRAADTDKLQLLLGLLCHLNDLPSLVFCNHRDTVERISQLLFDNGLPHGIFHGGMDQEDRERALIKFRNGTFRTLVTTDLASRGLDIPEIGAVIHYQLPLTEEVFTHRNGRTARMQADGTAFLMLSVDDYLPPFLDESPELLELSSAEALPAPSVWKTLCMAVGKKEKVNKMDIVGFLLQKGGLAKEDLGKIEVLDHAAFAAVSSDKIRQTLDLIRTEKIKNRKAKFWIE